MLIQSIGELFTFQTFGDREKNNKFVKTLHGTLSEHREQLESLNAQGAGVFFTVNETDQRGRKAENVTRVRALFADFDTVDHGRTFNYFLPPSYVVESSPGKHHAYWLLADTLPPDEFRVCQTALAELLGSDPKINDLPRVMRVPGFLHHKNEPFLVREIVSTDRRYTAAELKHWIGVDERVCASAHTEPPTDKITYIKDDPEAVKILNTLLLELLSAGEGERNNTLNRVAYLAYCLVRAGRLYKDDVYSQLLQTATEIGLSEEEADTTIRSARRKSKPEFSDLQLLPDLADTPPGDTQKKAKRNGINLVLMSDLPPANPDWLWEGWLCRAAYNSLAGVPGAGKTNIALDFASIISRGGRWPDGTQCAEPQFVLIFTTEDDYSMTIVPRLLKAGADMTRIATVNTVVVDGKTQYFNPAKHLPLVAAYMREFSDKIGKLGLVIIDPIVSAITGDHNKNEEVRRGMEPVLNLAKSTGCAILGITHFGKNGQGKDPNERVLGSTAFTGIARINMFAITETTENGELQRTFIKGKTNIAAATGGYRYSLDVGPVANIKATTSVHWGEFVDGTAADIVSSADQTQDEKSLMAEARRFLLDYLADGARDSKHGEAQARNLGISKSTLFYARRALKIQSRRSGAGWEWAPLDDGL